jgi:hypothetical protein
MSHSVCAAIAITCAALCCAGCKSRPASPEVARVGSSVLTLDELYKSIPPEYSDFITREQIVNYVKQWIDNKILYHEALRLKIDKEETIHERLLRMKEDLLCAELVSRNAVPLQDIRVPDSLIEKYYDENKAKFMREKNVAKYLQIVCDDIGTARKVRTLVTPDNFLFLATQYSKVPPPDVRNVPYVKLDEIPPELAQEVSATAINGTTSVIKTGIGYCIVRVLDKQPKGTLCQLAEVRDDITNILAAKMQNTALERLISSLRTKMIVETHLEIIAEQRKSAPAEGAVPKTADTLPDTATPESKE